MRPPFPLLRLGGFPGASVITVVAGSPPGLQSHGQGGETMTVKIRINGREYLLSWEEFEKALMRNDLSGGPIEVLAIFRGVRPCYSLQVG